MEKTLRPVLIFSSESETVIWAEKTFNEIISRMVKEVKK